MRHSYPKAVRYVTSWLTTRADVVEDEIPIDRGDMKVPATVARPRRTSGPLPAWIVLHGITRPGRDHAQLQRFVRATAATGAVVIVPEVPEWRELSLAPGITHPTVAGAIAALRDFPQAADGPYGLVGFSFGAPHAIAALADPELSASLSGAVGFGGYAHLDRTFRFLMTGSHEWEGKDYSLRPDPYGRWIVAANYLAHTEAHSDAEDVALGLRRLAALAGDTGAVAWDPRYDSAKVEERAAIATSRRDLFDLFATPSNQEPDPAAGAAIADELLAAARRVEPELEILDRVAHIRRPVHILHGYRDHLIPFSEALRLKSALPDTIESRATVTRLFGHSGQDPLPSLFRTVKEVPLFLRAIAGIFGAV